LDRWQLELAQENLDEILDRALADSPQFIEWENQTVVVISETEYERRRAAKSATGQLSETDVDS
jgi:hypothetical protein